MSEGSTLAPNASEPSLFDSLAQLVPQICRLPTIACLYYGEEIGMCITDPTRIEDVHDPIGKLGWPKERPRWRANIDAVGCTRRAELYVLAAPRIAVALTAGIYNVEVEDRSPDSILSTYKRLLQLRKSVPTLRKGSYQAMLRDDPDIFAYIRKTAGSTVLVVLDMSAKHRTVPLKHDDGTLNHLLYC